MNKYMKYYNKTRYLSIYEKTPIKEKTILLESQKGKNLNGNIFYILKELMNNKEYESYKVFLSVDEKSVNKYTLLLKQYSLNPELVIVESVKYFKILSSAQYLITDTSFIPNFIKKEGQILLNVWHGTPLKNLGKKDHSGFHAIGNIQKNFFVADYLLYPNEYMMNHMIEDYMLENICDAKCILHGYPRNDVFFQSKKQEIIDKYHLNQKEIIAYMPTWRGVVGHIQDEISTLKNILRKIDQRLNEHQILMVNLHPFINDVINYDEFIHIMPFPNEYETYDVLNLSDQLITDYSSVFFDYANTRNKIILFTYDLEEYQRDRGLYIDLESLPFPIVNNVENLIKEINSSKEYNDEEFLKMYCPYDNAMATSSLLKYIFYKNGKINVVPVYNNQKQNILIYAGNLAKNGITTALFNLLKNVDTQKYNYYITFNSSSVKNYKETLLNLPDNVRYISMLGMMNASLFQKCFLLMSRRIKSFKQFDLPLFDYIFKNEIKRCFGNIPFSHVIQYNGYDFKYELMFGRFNSRRIIFVHGNMVSEIENKHNQHPKVLEYAYNHYDKVAIVTEDMRKPTLTFCHDNNRIYVAKNIIDYKKILDFSYKEISFDQDTQSNISLEKLNQILNTDDKKFVTVGRFSSEKGHQRLIESFDELYKEKKNIYLIIIGGHGEMFQQTIDFADTLTSRENIIIIKSVSNPYAILKKCDYFVLSSFYEGFGLVLAEANILGLPVFSTNIPGPRGFMEKYKGLLVDNSKQGIIDGMQLMLDGKVSVMDINFEEYNQEAIKEFELLLSRDEKVKEYENNK